MGRKFGAVPLWEKGWVPTSHNVASAEAYLHAKWQLDSSIRLATIHGPKSGGCCARPFGGAGFPCNNVA